MLPLNNNPMPNEVDMQHMAAMQALANRPQRVNHPIPQWALDQLRAVARLPQPQPVVAEDAMDVETETPPPPGQPLPLRQRGVHVETLLVLVEGRPLPARLYAAPHLRIA